MSLPDPTNGTFLPSTAACPLNMILSICFACLFLFDIAAIIRFALANSFSPSVSLAFLIDSPSAWYRTTARSPNRTAIFKLVILILRPDHQNSCVLFLSSYFSTISLIQNSNYSVAIKQLGSKNKTAIRVSMHKLTLEKTYTCVSREWQYLCIGDNMKTMKVTDWGGG